jgi:excinuclease ABC subunit C
MTEISHGYQNPLADLWDKTFFHSLPLDPGVYFFLDKRGEPLYIGKANQLKKRLQSYANAKPGRVGEHILEMLEHVRNLRWEIHESGEAALIRESELIRAYRPPFNIIGTEPVPYLYCGLRIVERSEPLAPVEFRLTHRDPEDGDAEAEDLSLFGCFPHRGKTKLGYSALLRLLFAATCRRDRFQLPAKLCRASPAYVYQLSLPHEWLKPLENFFAGKNAELLRLVFDRLMSREALSPVLYAPLQRDFNTAREFYAIGPEASRRLTRKAGLRKRIVSQSEMNRLIRELSASP